MSNLLSLDLCRQLLHVLFISLLCRSIPFLLGELPHDASYRLLVAFNHACASLGNSGLFEFGLDFFFLQLHYD